METCGVQRFLFLWSLLGFPQLTNVINFSTICWTGSLF